ncbi:MAG: carbon storage regulator CsrA [Planctomycetota bacterium]
MLVLSRQRNETIMIGDEVEVTVIDIRGDKVRLGINAPREVTVHRKEVYEAIKRENQAAAQVQPDASASPDSAGSPPAQQPRPTVKVVDMSKTPRNKPRRPRDESAAGGSQNA